MRVSNTWTTDDRHEYPREPQRWGSLYYEKEGVSVSEKKKQNPPKFKLEERLSEHEIKQLMGIYQDKYKRVNGKVKRK